MSRNCFCATSAWARCRSAWACRTASWGSVGSSWAISCPARTVSLKLAYRWEISPDTWVPTDTVLTAPRVPVADTVCTRSPRVTAEVRKASLALPPRASRATVAAAPGSRSGSYASSSLVLHGEPPDDRRGRKLNKREGRAYSPYACTICGHRPGGPSFCSWEQQPVTIALRTRPLRWSPPQT